MAYLYILAAIGLAFHLLPQHADACGGFFCTNVPVNQAAENILFVYDKNENDIDQSDVTAVVQILYDGPSEEFAWVLPVPDVGEDLGVSVSSNEAFRRLEQATDPQYILEEEKQDEDSQCESPPILFKVEDSVAASPSVTIVKSGEVGPYDFVLIRFDKPEGDEVSDQDAGVIAVEWLKGEGYDVLDDDDTSETLGSYLNDGMLLIAFRLTKGKDVSTGAIRPVVLEYKSARPMIPIRPTAVAANDDMGIRVWVTSKERAYPFTYLSLELNEVLINWFFWQSNYDDVVTAAADEAGGQGFVTELVADTEDYGDVIFGSLDREAWKNYFDNAPEDGFEAIQQASWNYRNWDGFREAIGAATTLPQDVTLDEFGRNPNDYQNDVTIDRETFLNELEANVIAPMNETQNLFNKLQKVTRMYTTMSAEEMTQDIEFFTMIGDDVSNVHTASIEYFCEEGMYIWDANWTITLSDGTKFNGTGQGFEPWPYTTEDMPAAARVLQISADGENEIENNKDAIAKALGNDTTDGLSKKELRKIKKQLRMKARRNRRRRRRNRRRERRERRKENNQV